MQGKTDANVTYTASLCLAVGAVVMALGAELFVSEPSFVRWFGVLAVATALGIFCIGWTLFSARATERNGFAPWWSIQKTLFRRYFDGA